MKAFITIFVLSVVSFAHGQCTNFIMDNYDSFEYSTVCPYIIPGTTYQNSPQTSAGFGPNHSGARHIYLNFANGYTGPAFDRPYTVCIGGTYRLSFYHRDAWGGQNNTTFNVYDANNVLLVSDVVPWTGTAWNHWVSPELTATTTTLRLEIVNNASNIGNNDMVVDDMALEVCSINETKVLLLCNNPGVTNLFDLFSANMPNTGTWNGPSPLANGFQGTFDATTDNEGTYNYAINGTPGCPTPSGTVIITGGSPVDLGADVYVCAPENTMFDAGAGYDFYIWSNGATTQTINVSAPGVYSVDASKLGGNLVQHGDFQGGTTAASNNFTTAYVPGTGGTFGLIGAPGQYGIATNPNSLHSNFSTCGDHTSGTGNMFIANGSSTPNTIVWEQTVQVDPNQDYFFSFWAMNVVNNPNISQLQLFINGTAIGPINTTTTACNWAEINDIWNSGANTQAVLSIRNFSTTGSGNDFAIDDIYFAPYCTFYDEVEIVLAPTSHTTVVTDLICNGDNSGEIEIVNAEGVNYSFDDQATWTTATSIAALPAGNYTVWSENQYGCQFSSDVTVNEPPVLGINVSNDTTVCENGTASISATASVLPSDYYWNFTADLGSNQSVSPIADSIVEVYAVDGNGCVSATEQIQISVRAPLDATISAPVTMCPGYPVTIGVQGINGGLAPYSIVWSTGETGNGTTMNIEVNPAVTETFEVTINDVCETTPIVLDVEVTVAPLPVPSMQSLDPSICEPAAFNLMNTTDPSMVQNVTWILSDGQFYVNQNDVITDPMPAGSYDVQMIVVSPDGCIDSITNYDYLTVYPLPTANFNWSPNPVQMFNTEVNFANQSFLGVDFEWTFEDGSQAYSFEENPKIQFPEGVTGNYSVTLIATTEFGCSDTITKIVEVLPEVIIYVPNTFTPDGDEFNQEWGVHVEGLDIYDFHVNVFNRWGELIWESHDPYATWDGTYNGKLVPNGVYTWTIRAGDMLNDTRYDWNGHVNVLR